MQPRLAALNGGVSSVGRNGKNDSGFGKSFGRIGEIRLKFFFTFNQTNIMLNKFFITQIIQILLFTIVFIFSTFVSAQSPTYKITYSTYLGGDDYSSIRGLDIDSVGNIYVVGETRSKNLVVTENALEKELKGWESSFIQVIDPTGKLIYSTYLNNTILVRLKVDLEGNVYLSGLLYNQPPPNQTTPTPFYTTSTAFQTTQGNRFVMKVDIKKAKILYVVGLSGIGLMVSNKMEIDKQGNLYLTGTTDDPSFPLTSEAFQKSFSKTSEYQTMAFITKLNPTGTKLLFSTFLGTPNQVGINDLKVDFDGNVYITGFSRSSDFPATPNAIQPKFKTNYSNEANGFLMKLNNTGNKILYSTFIGGSDSYCSSIAINERGNVYVAGMTNSDGFTATTGAYQTKFRGKDKNIFIAKFDSSLTGLEFSTFLSNSETDLSKINIDQDGKVYVIGGTNDAKFPVTQNAYQRHYGMFNLFEAIFSDGRIPDDAFVSIFNSSGSQLIYSTYLGGLGDDVASDIAVETNGNIYVVGAASSSKFPKTPDALQKKWKLQAGFLTKFSKF